MSIIIGGMRPLFLALSLAVGFSAPAAAQAPARPAQAPPATTNPPAASPKQSQAAPKADEDGPAYYFVLGRHLEGDGKLDEAIAAHKKAIALAPDSAELRAELAGLYARNDRAAEALDTAQDALKRDPDNQEANKIAGTIYAALGEQRQPIRPGDNPAEYQGRAIAALEKARVDGTFDINIELMLGRLYAQAGEFDKALPLLRHVVDDQPGYQEGALLLAAAQESAGKSDDAIATLQRTLEFNPDYYRGQLRLAETLERAERWEDAADALGRAQALNTRNAALAPRRALALLNAGKAADARKILQPLADAAPADAPTLYLLAEAQRADHDLAAAEATVRKLLTAHPDDARGMHVLSLIQQERGDNKAAEGTLRDLVTKNPQDANALNSLGYMLAERGERLDEAVQLLQRALKIDPDNPSFLDSLGWAYFQQGRLEQADQPLTQAAAKLATSSVVQEHLGDLRFKQQRFADAASAWERALSGDGQSIDRGRIEKKIRDARARMEPQ
jgi:tetratricopeptide (TPR) repeat protein